MNILIIAIGTRGDVQPFFGRRIADLGAGPEPIPQKRLTADRMAPALESALSENRERRAETLGGAIRAENGGENTVHVIETQ